LPLECVATPRGRLRIRQTEHRITGPARLERAGLLQVFAFEEQLGPGQFIHHAPYACLLERIYRHFFFGRFEARHQP
jgi:hypothetical protein